MRFVIQAALSGNHISYDKNNTTVNVHNVGLAYPSRIVSLFFYLNFILAFLPQNVNRFLIF